MSVLRRANPALASRILRPRFSAPRAAYSTTQDKVQTPLQSQRKDQIASAGLRPAEANHTVQTPVQPQDPAKLQSAPPLTIRDRGPLYTLFGGLIAGSVFVYFYYQHRKEHMERKWAAMLKDAEVKQSVGG